MERFVPLALCLVASLFATLGSNTGFWSRVELHGLFLARRGRFDQGAWGYRALSRAAGRTFA